jgi:hypothetical protein
MSLGIIPPRKSAELENLSFELGRKDLKSIGKIQPGGVS